MQNLSLISDARHGAIDYRYVLADTFSVHVVFPDQLAQTEPNTVVFVDIDLNHPLHADAVRQWLRRRANHGMTVFAVDKGSRVQIVRAYSIGATDIVFRPFNRDTLLRILLQDRSSAQRQSAVSESKAYGVTSGIGALQNIFLSASDGAPLNPQIIETAGQALVEQIEEFGFVDWVQAVRTHHDRTYQHCLLVTGAAAAFALELRFSKADNTRVATAGLLHDIGKAKIPLAILDKPEKLDPEEMATIKTHARLGHEALQSTIGIDPDILDAVLHHHEYLDGTGYPDRLRGAEISDLTRVVTITDVFAALIEQRPYKRCMPGDKAYEHLLYMNGKLDGDLVRAFKPLSQAQFD